MQLKKGNKADIQFIVKDSNRDVITNLSIATDIIFVLKLNRSDIDDDAIVYKHLSDGIIINYPVLGNIIVPLTSVDMNIDAANYFMGLKIVYSATNQQEVSIKSNDISDINYMDSVAVVENIVHV